MKNLQVILIFMLLSTPAIAQKIPYNINTRKYPLGDEFDKLLPVKLGKWTRFAFHDFVPGQENGKVYYTSNGDQVYLTFGKAYSQSALNTAWTKIYDDATDGKMEQVKQKNTTNTTNKYLLMNGKAGFFYGWTRNFYYFTIETRNKDLADEFMTVFPY